MRRFEDFDIINVPEIVSVKNNFDLLNAPADHPSRRETDTYYLEKDWILRTQTTVMWPYYFSEENIKKTGNRRRNQRFVFRQSLPQRRN